MTTPRWFGPGSVGARLVRTAVVGVGVAPLVVWMLGRWPVARTLLAPFEAWFAYQCHRDAERTFELFGVSAPVCVRCLGIYLGLGLGALVLRPRLAPWPLRIWVAGAAFVMLLDVWTEVLDMRPAWAVLRLTTGLLLSYPVGASLVLAARDE